MQKPLVILFFTGFLLLITVMMPYAKESSAYSQMGVIVNGQIITPGQDLLTVAGIAGFPDRIRAVRAKDEKMDYVMLSYFTYGVTIDIQNDSNTVQGILVQENSVKLVGIPFKLGESAQQVNKIWGKPDAEYPGYLCYWKRGLYIGVDGSGRISHLMIVAPGSEELHPDDKKKQNTPPSGSG